LITNFIPRGAYEDIINVLGHWKIMDMKSLKKMTNYDTEYPNLLRQVRRLEKNNLVKSVSDGSKRKYVYLSDRGLKFTRFNMSSEISTDNMTHDLITGTVLRALIESKYFFNGVMYHQLENDKVFPDAGASFAISNRTFRVGIEVELTQKESNRVKNKYALYSKDSCFDYSLFIINKLPLYKTYCRLLSSMNEETQISNILLYDKELNTYKFSPTESEYFYKGETMKFDEIFSD